MNSRCCTSYMQQECSKCDVYKNKYYKIMLGARIKQSRLEQITKKTFRQFDILFV